ncbi:MAG TPA: hypothetical protein VFB21_17150 [Chthonomonadaceae bacterium]|nr:hypothetical protein [Chthonomonadaceae bacterium]
MRAEEEAESRERQARVQRLEELRRDLRTEEAARRAYAVEALLALLWIAEGRDRLAVGCALCDYPPQAEKEAIPLSVLRLCARLNHAAPESDLPPPPPAAERRAWAGKAVAAVLTGALDTLKAALRAPSEAQGERLSQETEVCRDALFLARVLAVEETVAPCVRLLRLLPADIVRETGPVARQTTALREAAARALGAVSPDALLPFWGEFCIQGQVARRDLLPVLDYLNDPRAVPYLMHLLERRTQWEDGEMVGWFVVRAFERIGDRRALPPLRRLAAGGGTPWQQAMRRRRSEPPPGISPELAREARRVLQALEQGRNRRDRDVLLRPATPRSDALLRPAADSSDAPDGQGKQLLRPEEPN